jgi:hypothetical protein
MAESRLAEELELQWRVLVEDDEGEAVEICLGVL